MAEWYTPDSKSRGRTDPKKWVDDELAAAERTEELNQGRSEAEDKYTTSQQRRTRDRLDTIEMLLLGASRLNMSESQKRSLADEAMRIAYGRPEEGESVSDRAASAFVPGAELIPSVRNRREKRHPVMYAQQAKAAELMTGKGFDTLRDSLEEYGGPPPRQDYSTEGGPMDALRPTLSNDDSYERVPGAGWGPAYAALPPGTEADQRNVDETLFQLSSSPSALKQTEREGKRFGEYVESLPSGKVTALPPKASGAEQEAFEKSLTPTPPATQKKKEKSREDEREEHLEEALMDLAPLSKEARTAAARKASRK